MAIRRQFVSADTRSRRARIAAVVLVVALVFAVPPVRRATAHAAGTLGLGVAKVTRSVGSWIGGLGTAVRSKRALEAENAQLRGDIERFAAQVAERQHLSAENAELKAALGRSGNARFILAAVLKKPPVSAYDTLVIDGGSADGIALGQTVYAHGEAPIGTVAEVTEHSALVRLWSAPGERTPVRLSPEGLDIELVGRGGGNFEATLPHDLSVPETAAAVTRETNARIVALFRKVISDQRDPFQKVLLVSPVNVNYLSFVEVRQ